MRRIVFLLTLLAGLAAAPRPVYGILHAGDVATDFHKTDLDGNPQTLSQYLGKVVILFVMGWD